MGTYTSKNPAHAGRCLKVEKRPKKTTRFAIPTQYGEWAVDLNRYDLHNLWAELGHLLKEMQND